MALVDVLQHLMKTNIDKKWDIFNCSSSDTDELLEIIRYVYLNIFPLNSQGPKIRSLSPFVQDYCIFLQNLQKLNSKNHQFSMSIVNEMVSTLINPETSSLQHLGAAQKVLENVSGFQEINCERRWALMAKWQLARMHHSAVGQSGAPSKTTVKER